MKPIEGAQSAGASGFFRGVGKGVVGCAFLSHIFSSLFVQLYMNSLVAKPAVGIMDLATNLSAGK